MIANLIGGFVAILIGASLVGPVSTEVNSAADACSQTAIGGIVYNQYDSGSNLCHNGTLATTNTTDALNPLYQTSGWGSTVLKLVPGFFALGILGIGIAVTYSSLRQAGVV